MSNIYKEMIQVCVYAASKVPPKICAVLIRKLKTFQRVGKVERIREKNIIIILTFHIHKIFFKVS
jgi:hypothetical protein